MLTPHFRFTPLFLTLTLSAAGLMAQQEGPRTTQILLRADSKAETIPTASAINLELNNKSIPVTALSPVKPNGTQIALLIDDGLSRDAGVQLPDLKQFATTLRPGTELLVGYMTNGRVQIVVPFTTDYAAAAGRIRLPFSAPGQSASPYLCLSDFVKRWPGQQEGSSRSKARFVMMITNGVDPYNGSTSITNQDSPYVTESIDDANRAGVAVFSIYYHDAGMGGGSASFSGQSYLNQVAEGTGGKSYYEGLGDPVALLPFLKQFQHDISETYVATFTADNGNSRGRLERLKVSTSVPKLKLRHAESVRSGNRESDDE